MSLLICDLTTCMHNRSVVGLPSVCFVSDTETGCPGYMHKDRYILLSLIEMAHRAKEQAWEGQAREKWQATNSKAKATASIKTPRPQELVGDEKHANGHGDRPQTF